MGRRVSTAATVVAVAVLVSLCCVDRVLAPDRVCSASPSHASTRTGNSGSWFVEAPCQDGDNCYANLYINPSDGGTGDGWFITLTGPCYGDPSGRSCDGWEEEDNIFIADMSDGVDFFAVERNWHEFAVTQADPGNHIRLYTKFDDDDCGDRTFYWWHYEGDKIVTSMRDLVTNSVVSTTRIGVGAVRELTIFGDGVGSYAYQAEEDLTRIGFTLSSDSDCRNPVAVSGHTNDDDTIVLGPFFQPGVYRFCASKDGGQAFFLQGASVTIEVLDDAEPTLATVNSPVVEAYDSTQTNAVRIANSALRTTSTRVGFVPLGTPCNIPYWERNGMWQVERWDGVPGGALELSSLYNLDDYPLKPTMTKFPTSTSINSQCEQCGYALHGIYFPQNTGNMRFDMVGDDQHECWMSNDDREDGLFSIMGPTYAVGFNNWGSDSSSYYMEEDIARAFMCRNKERTGGDHMRIRTRNTGGPWGPSLIGTPVNQRRSEDLTWHGVTVGDTQYPMLDTPITQAGLYQLCASTNDGLFWTEQSGQILQVVDHTPHSVTGMVDPEGGIMYAGVAQLVNFTGNLRLDGSGDARIRVMEPFTSGCGGGQAEDTYTLYTLPYTTVTLSTAGVYRICYTSNGGTYVEQEGLFLTAIATTPNTVSKIHPSVVGPGLSVALRVADIGLHANVSFSRFALCAGACSGCPSPLEVTYPAVFVSQPFTITSPSSPDTYNFCLWDPSVNDYVTQSGVTLTVLPSGGLSAVIPQTFGFGTSPVFSFVDAQVSDLGTWVAFTRFGSCGVIEAETDITASFTTTLSAPLGTAATYTVCYSLDGGLSWTYLDGVTVTAFQPQADTLGGASPLTLVKDAATPVFFGQLPPVDNALGAATAVNNPSTCTDSFPLTNPILADPDTAIDPLYFCVSVDGGATWVIQDFTFTVVNAVASGTATMLTPAVGSVFLPGDSVSLRVNAPTNYPSARTGLALDGACGDPSSFQAGQSFSYTSSGTTIIIPLDRVPNVATEIAMRLYLCFSPDGVDWYQMDNEYITVALLHPHVISAVSPTAIVSGNTVLITQLTGVTVLPGTRVRLADNPMCNPSGLGPAGDPTAVTAVPSGGTPLSIGVVTAPPGLIYLCLSVDGDAGTFVAQTGVAVNIIDATAAAAIDSITPTAVALGAPFAVTAAFTANGNPESGTMLGFSSTTDCSSPLSNTPYESPGTINPDPLLVAAVYKVCWTQDSTPIAQALSGVEVSVVDATVTSLSAVVPDTLVEGLAQSVRFVGAVGTATSFVALSSDGCTSAAGSTATPLTLDDVDTVAIDTSGLSPGTYTVCYMSFSTWRAQDETILILTAEATSLSNVSPLVVGFDSDALVTVDGAQPSATTAVGFSTNGCVLVVNQTPLTASGPITITNAMAAGSYVTCYTVNGVTWVPQTDPSTFLEVVGATSSSISAIAPTAIAALTTPEVTLSGLPASDLSATSEFAFGVGGCGVLFGRTPFGGSLQLTLASGLPTAEPQLVLCYTVNAGKAWTQQDGVTVDVLVATATSITAVTESVWGVNHLATTSLTGIVDAGYTYVAFAATASGCSSSAARRGVTQYTDNVAEEITLDTAISVAGDFYKVCYSMSGLGGPWIAQAGPLVRVIQAVSDSIASISPPAIGTNTHPMLTFTGAVPSQSTRIGFGAGSCAAPVATFAYTSSAPVMLPAPLAPSFDELCYSTDNGVSYITQTSAAFETVDAFNETLAGVTPTVVGVGSTFNMAVTGQDPTPGAQIAFAAPGACPTGPYEGVTAYTAAAGLTIGSPISSAGAYDVCFSIDGAAWLTQDGLSVVALEAAAGDLLLAGPSAIGNGTTPVMKLNLNATRVPVVTPTTYVAWSLDPSCAAGHVGATRLTAVINAVAIGSAILVPGNYTTCLSFAGTGVGYAPQPAAGNLIVAGATNVTITDIQPRLVTSDVAPTLILTGAVPTPTTRVAFAAVGECGQTASRFAETPIDVPGPLLLEQALDTGNPYVRMAACYSVNNGDTWVEQELVTIEVTAECATLTNCGDCHANAFCTFCLATGECALNVTGCEVADMVGPADACPAVVTFDPPSGDISGGTPVTLGFDYLVHNASNATTTELSCRWSVGQTVVNSPFVTFNATHGTCLSPMQVNNAPASALSLTWNNEPYAPVTLFFVYYDCSVGDYSCGDCVVREAECGFCLETQRCGPSRDCAAANGTYTKTMCPRVESLDPDAINFRGAVDVTMTGDMFVDVGLVQCAFDGVPTNATTFVSEAEVICEAPAGEAGTQIDVALWVNGREYTTTPGRLRFEDDPAEVADNSVVTYAALGGAALALILVIVACCLCVCLRRKNRENYLPPKLTAAQERDLMFGKVDGVSHGKDLFRALNQFIDLVLMADKSIVNYICDVVPSTEADLVAKSLIFLHEDAGQSVPLMKARIGHEVDQALSLATLFRTNSVATKMFKTYSRMAGLHYVRDTLGYEINFNLAQFADDDLDIKKAKGTEEDTLNKFNLLTVCQKIFVSIVKSESEVPLAFRAVFEHVRRSVEERFPIRVEDLAVVIAGGLNNSLDETEENYTHSADTFGVMQTVRGQVESDLVALATILPTMTTELATLSETVGQLDRHVKRIIKSFGELEGALDPDSPAAARLLEEHANKQNAVAVGGFFFLRFMIPAITNPVGFQIVAEMPPPNQHKMLVLVSKVLQNLSNGINFGAKEKGMTQLNEFIDSNIVKMRSLFDRLSTVPAGVAGDGGDLSEALAGEQVEIPRKVIEEAAARLYGYVDQNLERILTSMRDVQGDDMQKARQCAMLLGNVMEQTRASLSADSALASFRAETGGDVSNIFASFAQSDRRASQAFDIDKLRASLGTDAFDEMQRGGGEADSSALGSALDTGGGVMMVDLPQTVPDSSESSDDSALALADGLLPEAPLTTPSALAVDVPDIPPSDDEGGDDAANDALLADVPDFVPSSESA